MIIFPADPLAPRRVDEHFRPEAEAAHEAGHQVAVVDHDLVCAGQAVEAVRLVPRQEDPAVPAAAVYRGWMVTAGQYTALAGALAERGVGLRTSPEQFRTAHELPGWYEALRDHTPASVWTEGADLDAFTAACEALPAGPAVLRDYVKSLKHSWSEAAYIPDTRDRGAARRIAERFLALRGDDFVGGLVVRSFEDFTTSEARTWWVDGRCEMVTAHPDTPDVVPEGADVASVAPVVARLGLPFVTVDLVLRADGVWRIVELGDGQVSDRPTSTSADVFVSAVYGD